jgi:hypothetical protein
LECFAIAEEEKKEEEEEEEEGLVFVLFLCTLKVPDSFPDSSAVVVIIVYRDLLSNTTDCTLRNSGLESH